MEKIAIQFHRCGTRFFKFSVAILVVVAAYSGIQVIPANAQGAGDLVVAPTRVVLEGRDRSAALSLVNRGSGSATYRISIVNMAMDESGQIKEVVEPTPNQKFADKLFRYSPRRVVLAPGAAQTIRLLLRKPKGLEEGEYRSHIFIRAVPKNNVGTSLEQNQDSGVRVQLIPIYGITIPVIIRHGKTKTDIKISDVKFMPADEKNKSPRLRFGLDRAGSASSYGDIRISFKPSTGGSEIVVGEITGLAVYTPNTRRMVELRLRVPDGINISKGTFKVTYNTPVRDGSKPMAESSHAVQ